MASSLHLRLAAECIAAGGVVAHPTEGVYGLACDPSDPDAVARVIAIKARDARKGFILIADDWARLTPWCETPTRSILNRMQASWPGPVTWIVDAAAHTDPVLTGGRDTIAVRVTAHPLSRALCKRAGHALLSTSANRSGLPAPRSALGVRAQLGDRVDRILSGALGGRTRPTAIFDARSGKELRPG